MQLNVQLLVLRYKRWQVFGQYLLTPRHRRCQANFARQFAAGAGVQVLNAFMSQAGLRHRVLGKVQVQLPRAGQRDFAGAAAKQGGVQTPFQTCHAFANSALRNAQRLRGAAHAQVLGHFNKRVESINRNCHCVNFGYKEFLL